MLCDPPHDDGWRNAWMQKSAKYKITNCANQKAC